MRRSTRVALLLVSVTLVSRTPAQPPPDTQPVVAEVEAIEGLRATVDSVTLRVTRDLRGLRDDCELTIPVRLIVPQRGTKEIEISSFATLVKVQDGTGQDLPLPPAAAPRPNWRFKRLETHRGGSDLQLSLFLPTPLPGRLNLIEAAFALREPAEKVTAECEFRNGATAKLGPLAVTVTRAEFRDDEVEVVTSLQATTVGLAWQGSGEVKVELLNVQVEPSWAWGRGVCLIAAPPLAAGRQVGR